MSTTVWLGRAAVIAVAGALLVLANPVAASAAVPTEVQLTFDPGAPVSGQNIEATAFIDWPTGPPPSGYVIFSNDAGYSVAVDTVTSPTTHFTTATTSVGEFVGGTHTISALFVPLVGGFTGSSGRATIAVQGILGTGLLFALPTMITVGTAVPLSAGLLLPSTAYPAGGTIAFSVNGSSVGSCVPQPGALKNSAGCGITAPPPTSAGSYAVTATFSQSPSFASVSRTLTGTAVAAPAKSIPVKAAPPPATTSTAAPTPSAAATPRALATQTPSPAPVALADRSTSTVTKAGVSPWPLILIALLGIILGAGVAILIVVLVRRRNPATPTG